MKIARFREYSLQIVRAIAVLFVGLLLNESAKALTPQTISVTQSALNVYASQSVTFTATGSNTGYAWTGTTATSGASVSQLWANPGTYKVSVQAPASGTYAASNVVNLTVTVEPPQPQYISAGPPSQSIYPGQTAYFSASGGQSGYVWTGALGNGGNGRGGSATQSWSTPGTYTVTVQAPALSTTYAASNVVTLSVTVLSPQQQTITASASTQTAFTGQTVYFNASGSNTGYTWTGGVTGTGATVSQSWTTPGTYTINVQAPATGAYLASSQVSLTITVEPPQAQTITAGPSSQTIYAGQTAYFSASGSSTGSYTWTGATGQYPGSVAYQSWTTPGTYTITVQSGASGGVYSASNVVSMAVTVLAAQSQTVTVTPSSQTVYVGQTASLIAYGSNTGYSWNGATGIAAQLYNHSWSAPGTYTVTVQGLASAPAGYAASNVATATITVLTAPAATLTAAPPNQGAYESSYVGFSASGSTSGSYSWTGVSTYSVSNGIGYASVTSSRTPGNYSVTVSAPNQGSVTLGYTVLAPQPQTITAGPANQTVYVGQMAEFAAYGSLTGVYGWTGAANSYGNTNYQTWNTPGTYTVTVGSGNGGTAYTDSNQVSMTVAVLPLQSQTVSVAPATQTIYAGQTANFYAYCSTTSNIQWTGAYYGQTTNGSNFQTFNSPGTYTITARALAGGGVYAASSAASMTVVVLPARVPQITASPTVQTVLVNQTAWFSASPGSPTGYTWIGAQPVTGVWATASQSWSTPGTYTVKVYEQAQSWSGYAQSNTVVLTVNVVTSLPPNENYAGSKQDKNGVQSGDPIMFATGADVLTRRLFWIPGPTRREFAISYNSGLASTQLSPGLFGYGWTSEFEASIAQSGSNLILHRDATHANTFVPVSGSTGTFNCSEEGEYYDTITTNSGGGWTLNRVDQSKEVFDSTGRLTEVDDAHGRKLTLAYNGSGQLSTITEPISGSSLSFSHNGSGLVSSIQDPLGSAVGLSYGTAGIIAQITDPNGHATSYSYDANRNLLVLSDNAGNALSTNTYDPLGRVITQADGVAGHAKTQLSYQQSGISSNIVTTITDRTGGVWVFTFDPDYHLINAKDPLGNAIVYTYDAAGNCTSKTDALGNVTAYGYDASGNVTSVTDPAGKVTKYTYDSHNNLLTETDPVGNVTTRTYDANNNLLTVTDAAGKTTTWTYDGNSLPLTKTLPNGGVFKYTYTGGLLTAVTDPNGVVTQLTYDADARIASAKDALGKVTTFAYDAAGNLLSLTNPLSQKTTRTYDYRNRVLTITDPANAAVGFAYDNNNNVTSFTDPAGNVTTYAYDGENRRLSTTDPLGHVTSQVYDLAGHVTQVTDGSGVTTTYQYDSAGRRTAVIDGLGNKTAIAYDPRDLTTSVTDPLKRVDAFGYDDAGRLTSLTDGLNQVTTQAFDVLDRVTSVTDPGKVNATQAFDPDGNRTGYTDGNGNAATLAYDLGDRLTGFTTPGGRTTAYTYDARSLLSTVTLPSGNASTLTYDDAGRVASLTDGVGTITYTRDGDGRVLTETEGSATTTKVYDGFGRLTQYTDGAGNTIGYAYDAAGNLSKLTYPDGKVVTYGYDKADRLVSVVDWASRTTTYAYDGAGRLTTTNRPNGTVQTITYDAAGQVTAISDVSSNGTTIFGATYAYDADGHLTGESTTPVPVIAAGSDVSTFDADNRIATFNGQSTQFDVNGNLLSAPGVAPGTYVYDARNRLTAAGGIAYAYDSDGRRISETDSTGTTQFVVDPNADLPRVLIRTTPDGATTRYVYGIGLCYEDSTTAGAHFYHFDQRGSTVALTDASGTTTDTIAYDPFGTIIARTGTTTALFLFDGRDGVEGDRNGLYYSRSRYYNSLLRRFINQDVLLGDVTNMRTLNRYSFTGDDPIDFIDPTGQNWAMAVKAFRLLGEVDGGIEVFGGGPVDPAADIIAGVATVGGLGYVAWELFQANPNVPQHCPMAADAANQPSDQAKEKTKPKAVKAPGVPTKDDGFVPPKNWDGKKVPAPNGGGYGYPDQKGDVWVPTGEGTPEAHAGPHWDVQQKSGGYRNVYPQR